MNNVVTANFAFKSVIRAYYRVFIYNVDIRGYLEC